jgi:hypothetical protein
MGLVWKLNIAIFLHGSSFDIGVFLELPHWSYFIRGNLAITLKMKSGNSLWGIRRLALFIGFTYWRLILRGEYD